MFCFQQVQLFLQGHKNRFGTCLSVNVMENNTNPSRALYGIFTGWRVEGGFPLFFFHFLVNKEAAFWLASNGIETQQLNLWFNVSTKN